MKFMCDITIGEGESVAPNTNFIKTWRIKNIGLLFLKIIIQKYFLILKKTFFFYKTGNRRWPYGCQLKLVNSNFTRVSSPYETTVQVNPLEAESEFDISIELKSPEQCGIYQSQYRLFTANNVPFGDPIWLVLNVEQGGVLGICQQLNSVNMFGNMSSNQNNININNNSSSSFNQFSPNFKTNIFNLPNTTSSTNNNNNNNNQLVSNNLNKFNLYDQQSNDLAAETSLVKHQQLTVNNEATSILNNQILDDEKRPDFYDDMFS